MLTSGRYIQRNTSVINKVLNSQIHNSPAQWFERLFSVPPKGFGKFYPPSGGGTAGVGGKSSQSAGRLSCSKLWIEILLLCIRALMLC